MVGFYLGFNLDKVWSIRNNVPFQNQNTNTRKDDALPTNPSNYSRYKPNPGRFYLQFIYLLRKSILNNV